MRRGRRQGRRVLLIAVGGPGSSGIADADWYAGTLPPRILETHDVVLFDARGTGATDWRGCPDAYREYVREETTSRREGVRGRLHRRGRARTGWTCGGSGRRPSSRTSRRSGRPSASRRWRCTARATGPSSRRRTRPAYPDRVSALVLDAPVDRRLDGIEVWQTAARGFGDVLEQTFRACDLDEECSDGLADPAAAWERLERRLDASDGLVGGAARWLRHAVRTDVSALEVMGAVRSALYESTGRATVLRALAAADRGDDRLLARLVESGGDQGVVAGGVRLLRDVVRGRPRVAHRSRRRRRGVRTGTASSGRWMRPAPTTSCGR